MTTYDENKLTKLSSLKVLAERIKTNFTTKSELNTIRSQVVETSSDVVQNTGAIDDLSEAINTIVDIVTELGTSNTILSNKIDNLFTSAAWENAYNQKTLEKYGIGRIIITETNTNPGTFIGGTWELFSQGRMIMGVEPSNPNFNEAGKTGGAVEHSHNLSQAGYAKAAIYGGEPFSISYTRTTGLDYESYFAAIGATGSKNQGYIRESTERAIALGGTTDSESSLPPFITCYVWKRVA